jgi:RNA polymerase sigma-70 factor (ECF subfamily)
MLYIRHCSAMSPTDLHSDLELLSRVREGDGSAFEAIYKRYYSLLYIHACKLLKESGEAEDCVQEVFSGLWQKSGQLEISVSLSSYLYTSIRNRVLNRIEHQRVKDAYLFSIQRFMKEGVSITDEQLRVRELTALIEKEIAALPEKMREVFELSRREELSHKEIAEKLNISDKTVKKQVSNALKILRGRLKGPLRLLFGALP